MSMPSEENFREWMCECGHVADDHHISWFAGHGTPLIEECEYWGWNEHGGAEWVEEEPGELDTFSSLPKGHWIEHCYHFKKAQ